jgi:iron(III) transport system permease protein
MTDASSVKATAHRNEMWGRFALRPTGIVVGLLMLAALGLIVYPAIILLRRVIADLPVGGAQLLTGNLSDLLPTVMLNTVIVVVGGTLLALAGGSTLAWINERTDANLGRAGDLLPLAPLIVPPVAGVMGWVVLLDPRAGLVNFALRAGLNAIGIDLIDGPINIYSYGGMIAITALYIVPYVYLVVSAALRQFDPAIEEASRVFAAGPLKTLLKITLPAIRPALVAATLLGFITGISMFAVPIVLGSGANIDVLSVVIYRKLETYPPQTAPALVMAGGMVVLIQLLLLAQRFIAPAGRHAVISSRGFRSARVGLGRWRRTFKAVAISYLFLTAILPVLGLVLVSLQPFWTPMVNVHVLSFKNFADVIINDRQTSRALFNSLLMGAITATVCMAVAGLMMLYFHQRKSAVSRIADSILTLPAAVPHTVIGIGFLLAFSIEPFRLYGTTAILLLAYVTMTLPFASRAASAAVAAIGPELSEASRVFRATEQTTLRRILFPLALPGLIAGWIVVFIHTIAEVTASVFLAGSSNPAIGRVLMELWVFGNFPQVAALALVMTLVSGTFVGLMLMIARRTHSITIS